MRFPLVLVTLIVSLQAKSSKCPYRCVCTDTEAFCDYIGAKSIPRPLPPALRSIYLRDNLIRRVSLPRLGRLSNLRHLLLKGNQIKEIDVKAFRDTTLLVSLSLTDNKLRKIAAGTFFPLKRLRVLSIRNNKLTDVDGLFVYTASLQLLNLGNNRIKTVSANTFSRNAELQVLDLHGNHIRTVHADAFRFMKQLRFLVLRDNLISQLDFRFPPNVQLELLDASNCRLRDVPTGLPKAVVDLRLSENRIRNIRKENFANVSKVRLLVLTGNEIADIERGALSGMDDLYDLYLVKNKLREIPAGLPRNLHGLYANFNNITSIREGTFTHNGKMEFLYVRNNELIEVEQTAFQGLYKVRAIDLSRNNVQDVKSLTFVQTPLLEMLDLSKNPLHKIQKGAFHGLRSLNILQLSSVGTQTPLPDNLFRDLGRVRFLDLSFSPALVSQLIANPRQLGSLVNVEDLNLMHNQLYHIPPIFPQLLRAVQLVKLLGNPWHCDTRIHTLLNWIRNATNVEFYGRPYLKCASPSELAGREVQGLEYYELPQPSPPPHEPDEGVILTVMNTGNTSVDIKVISDSGRTYDQDEIYYPEASSKVRVITDGEQVGVKVHAHSGVQIENIDTFDSSKDEQKKQDKKSPKSIKKDARDRNPFSGLSGLDDSQGPPLGKDDSSDELHSGDKRN